MKLNRHVLTLSLRIFVVLLVVVAFVQFFQSLGEPQPQQETQQHEAQHHHKERHHEVQYSLSGVSYEDLLGMIRTQANSTCRFEPYDLLKNKSTKDKHLGSCTPTHTWFNLKTQTIRMKCPKATQVPLIYNNNRFAAHLIDERNWIMFPKELYRKFDEFSVKGFEVIQTACVDLETKSSFHSFFAQAVRDERLVEERKEVLQEYVESNPKVKPNKEKRPLDIHVIVVDSTGRDFFHRHFAHTREYLKELGREKDLSVIEMEQYQVLEVNSYPNMYQFSTGLAIPLNESAPRYDKGVQERLSGKPIKVPLLWDHLKQMGYVSSVGEDVSNSPHTAGSIYGYGNQKLTYDIYPSYHLVVDRVTRQLRYPFENRHWLCPCAGDKFMSNHVFSFARSMFQEYHDLPKFLMTVHDEPHDTVGNQVLMLDPDLKNYLKWLHTSGRFKHTAVVLMADHGLHYGPMYSSNKTQALWEHARPFATFILPKYAATDQLKQNAKRLVNIRDFHMTIRDLASFPHRSTENSVSSLARSLLHDTIDVNRTCEEMQVNGKYRIACRNFTS